MVYDSRDITVMLKQLDIALTRYDGTFMRTQNLTPAQCEMLGYLIAQDGRDISASDMNREFGLSKATISANMKGLREKGYIIVNTRECDERKKEIRLTGKAYELARQIDIKMEGRSQCLLRGFSGEETERVKKYLSRMLSNIKEGSQNERRSTLDQNIDKTSQTI